MGRKGKMKGRGGKKGKGGKGNGRELCPTQNKSLAAPLTEC